MDRYALGIVFGLVFGILDVLIMIPMPEKDKRKKREAMVGAFIERFMLGLIIPNADFGVNYAISGTLLGLGLSLPTAIITRVYVPIVAIGIVGGLVLGIIANYTL